MVSFRLMTTDDLPFLNRMVALAGWNQIGADWLRYIELEPEGCFVAELNGVPVGTATTITYEDKVGWIGMVIVDPAARGKGVGTELLNQCISYLRSRVACIKLDATPMGEPIYRKLGFSPEYRVSRMLLERGSWGNRQSASQLVPKQLYHYDAEAFGASRRRVLEKLLQEYPHQLVWRGSDHNVRGYAMANRGQTAWHIGPAVADSDQLFADLLSEILELTPSTGIFIDVPHFGQKRFQILESNGFREVRHYTRMVLGEDISPGVPQKVFATARAEKG